MRFELNWRHFRRLWFIVWHLSMGFNPAIYSGVAVMWKDKILFSCDYTKRVGLLTIIRDKCILTRIWSH